MNIVILQKVMKLFHFLFPYWVFLVAWGMTHTPPVSRPLPHIAYYVFEPIAIRGKCSDRAPACIPIFPCVCVREVSLPSVGSESLRQNINANVGLFHKKFFAVEWTVILQNCVHSFGHLVDSSDKEMQ